MKRLNRIDISKMTARKIRQIGKPVSEIARKLGVNKSTVYRWMNPKYEQIIDLQSYLLLDKLDRFSYQNL